LTAFWMMLAMFAIWALQLAWGGVALTGILALAAAFMLRRG